jgi:hypothetical protein
MSVQFRYNIMDCLILRQRDKLIMHVNLGRMNNASNAIAVKNQVVGIVGYTFEI